MSITKGELANRILKTIGVNTRFSDADAEEIADVIAYQEDWLRSQSARGLALGYDFSDPSPEAPTELPAWSLQGVIGSVAFTILPYYNKPVPAGLSAMIAGGMATIYQRTSGDPCVVNPSGMPVGSGHPYNTYGPKRFGPDNRIRSEDGSYIEDEAGDAYTTS